MEHNNISISVSQFMDFCKTPAHYKYFHIDGKIKTTDSMIEGRALHTLVLEPEKFDSQFYTEIKVPAGCTLLTTVDDLKNFLRSCDEKVTGKKDELLDRAREVVISRKMDLVLFQEDLEKLYSERHKLTQNKYESLCEMRDSVYNHKFYKRYKDQGHVEESFKCIIEDVEFRGRIDWLIFNEGLNSYIVLDLKKTTSSDPFKFERTCYDYNYFVQAYLYSEMIKQNKNADTLYAYLAVEGSAPYICECLAADIAHIDAGEQLVKSKIKSFKKCLENNFWPGYTDGLLKNISLPNYALDKIASEVSNV